MFVQDFHGHVYSLGEFLLGPPPVDVVRDGATPDRVERLGRGTAGGFLLRLGGLTTVYVSVVRAMVGDMARSSDPRDVLVGALALDALMLGAEQRLPTVLVGHGGSLCIEVVFQDSSHAIGDGDVPLPTVVVLEWGSGIGPIAEFDDVCAGS